MVLSCMSIRERKNEGKPLFMSISLTCFIGIKAGHVVVGGGSMRGEVFYNCSFKEFNKRNLSISTLQMNICRTKSLSLACTEVTHIHCES